MQRRHVNYKSAVDLYQLERTSGDIIKSPRMFGVEFEMVPRVPFNSSSYSATENSIPSAWGVTSDNSLSDGGIEVQTPPMRMSTAEKSVMEFCKNATGIGWTVDNSCGTHVHIDANDIKKRDDLVRRLFLLYFVLDYSILAMVPMSRQKNKYCAPLDKSRNKGLPNVRSSVAVKGWELEKIITTPMNRMDFLCMYYKADPENIPRELSNHYNEARYHGINFHPMYSNFGTVEIRYHEGTLDAKDFLHWVAFHQHIVDNSRIMRESDSLMLFHIKGPKTRLRRYAEMTKMPQYLLDYACKRIDKFKS